MFTRYDLIRVLTEVEGIILRVDPSLAELSGPGPAEPGRATPVRVSRPAYCRADVKSRRQGTARQQAGRPGGNDRCPPGYPHAGSEGVGRAVNTARSSFGRRRMVARPVRRSLKSAADSVKVSGANDDP
jgi:hypothetical protein